MIGAFPEIFLCGIWLYFYLIATLKITVYKLHVLICYFKH
jgi:hypothetical protein